MTEIARTVFLEAALEYAARGWRVVPLHHTSSSGNCSCDRGDACPENSRGKHPRITAWQNNATTDPTQIEVWWAQWPMANVGVLLGQNSNLIDMEVDTKQGEADYVDLFDGNPPITPTFRSTRGMHRLFEWMDGLPGGAKIDIGGVGVRTGNDFRGAQSVFPPSRHRTGAPYEWLVHPSDCPPPRLSPEIFAKLWNLSGEKDLSKTHKKKVTARESLYEFKEICAGGRHDALLSEACQLWNEQQRLYGTNCFNDPRSQSTVYARIWAWNKASCSPPKDENSVQTDVESARVYVRDSSRDTNPTTSLTSLGLEFKDGEWGPGLWWIKSSNGDPPMIHLHAPFLPNKFLELTMEQYDSAAKVHLAILGATGIVCLDDGVLPWRSIWKGHAGKSSENGKPKRKLRGLEAKLLDKVKRIEAPPEIKRVNIVATFLWGCVCKAQEVDTSDGKELNSARPFRKSGELWFSFKAVTQAAGFDSDKITRNELSRLCRELQVKDRDAATKEGKRLSFMVLDKQGINLLEGMAFHRGNAAVPIREK